MMTGEVDSKSHAQVGSGWLAEDDVRIGRVQEPENRRLRQQSMGNTGSHAVASVPDRELLTLVPCIGGAMCMSRWSFHGHSKTMNGLGFMQ